MVAPEKLQVKLTASEVAKIRKVMEENSGAPPPLTDLHILPRKDRRYRAWLRADYPQHTTFPADAVSVGSEIFLLECTGPEWQSPEAETVKLLSHEIAHVLLDLVMEEPYASDAIDLPVLLNGKIVLLDETFRGRVRRE